MSNLNYNNIIPPTNTPQPINHGFININPTAVNLHKQIQQKVLLKLQFWGSSNFVYIPMLSEEQFIICANIIKFKEYLIDSKVTKIELVDNRNYKPVAVAFITWLSYLRSIEDKVLIQTKPSSSK